MYVVVHTTQPVLLFNPANDVVEAGVACLAFVQDNTANAKIESDNSFMLSVF